MPTKSKRNAQGSGTIRKKTVTKNGKSYTYWEARFTAGRNPGTGRQVQRSITGKTQKEVREKLQKSAVELNTGEYFEPSKMTVGEWLDIWTAEYMWDKKYATIKLYKAQVKVHIKPALGAVKLSALAPHDIQRFYNGLLRDGHEIRKKDKSGKMIIEHKPLSTKSVRNIHGILTKALSVAINMGYLRTNPADRVTLPRVEKTEIRPLTDEQVKDLLKVAEADEYGAIFKVILFTGLRESEATGLTWDCVDFKTGRMTISKQLQKRPERDGGFVFAPLKNDKIRVIAPAPYVLQVLKDRKQQQIEDSFKAGKAWEAWASAKEQEKALIFTNTLGQHLHPQTVYAHLKKLAAAVGASGACVHDLRHTFAVLSLQNGDDVKTVQENLGHATAAFTLDVYGHVSERMKDDSATRMQNYINAIKEA